MNPYNFATLFFAFSTFLIAIFVWLKRQGEVGKRFLFFCFFVTIWGIGVSYEMSDSVSYEFTLFVTRFGNTAAIFIPVTWFHFVCVYLGIHQEKKRVLKILYYVSILYSFIGFSPWFIRELKPIMNFKHYARVGEGYPIFTIFFFTIVSYGFVLLFKKFKTENSEEKAQLKGFIFATLCGFGGGSFAFPPAYGISVPQFGLFLMPIYPFAMAYAMVKHKLFDVEQIAQAFQREKLATIGLIAASINHEIRNPLYVVKGLLETYIDDSESGRERKTPVEVSKKALVQISRALDVITKLNRFAKPATEAITQNSKAPIREALQNVLDLVSYEFELDKIHIKNEIHSNLPNIQADQRQLEEILFNLIVNACHAMSAEQRKGDRQEVLLASPAGGPVPFSGQAEEGVRQGGTLDIRSAIHDARITLTISDTGTGISPEQAKHLFEPFHTTKGEQGTGLGLYITKQLVERNHGKISVKSKEDKGTSFVLEFRAFHVTV